MIDIEGTNIWIHRGNVVEFTINLIGDDIPENDTEVLFQVKKYPVYPQNSVTVIEKSFPVENGSFVIDIQKEDTQNLPTGTYYWNACILYADGTQPWTLLKNASQFIIMPEFGNV